MHLVHLSWTQYLVRFSSLRPPLHGGVQRSQPSARRFDPSSRGLAEREDGLFGAVSDECLVRVALDFPYTRLDVSDCFKEQQTHHEIVGQGLSKHDLMPC